MKFYSVITRVGLVGLALGEPNLWEQTSLSGAVQDVNDVLDSLAKDSDSFPEVASDTDPRVVTALREFMQIVDGARATCRIWSPVREVVFESTEQVHNANEQLSTFTVKEESLPLNGELLGVLPVARRFEFRLPDQTVVRGRIGREIEDPETLRAWEGQTCVAYVRVVTVERPEKPLSPRYTLQRIEGGGFRNS